VVTKKPLEQASGLRQPYENQSISPSKLMGQAFQGSTSDNWTLGGDVVVDLALWF
jgi:hypothetical protein